MLARCRSLYTTFTARRRSLYTTFTARCQSLWWWPRSELTTTLKEPATGRVDCSRLDPMNWRMLRRSLALERLFFNKGGRICMRLQRKRAKERVGRRASILRYLCRREYVAMPTLPAQRPLRPGRAGLDGKWVWAHRGHITNLSLRDRYTLDRVACSLM